ncbi:hypothetical protein P873_06350 [Arenimonas composti TR7-09 = DSM 18010]|uniref:Uncharacterized protein n=2 Tax=Arenimonas TaxID=490567 RepID=A0A091BFF7_9GAMM|nr:hypothetical protein [Arenimonas composti]KFN50292.1 hypothetical protein P873_06350 [Arenimonas composti TR7-09 = DSM 18010]
MSFDRRTLTLQLCGLMFAVAMAVGLQAREKLATVDQAYPYRVADSVRGGCGFDYIDLDGHASPLPLAITGDDADDTGALLTLREPFELYQRPSPSLVVSGNGYLAAVDALAADDGSDFANACPEDVGRRPPGGSRILVYHDDLRARPGGGVRHAWFPSCPRASDSGEPEPCTVIEWNGYERVSPLPSSRPLQAQAVLYHRSHEIALQYASVDDSHAASATIGVMGLEGRAARSASCNLEQRTLARSSVCFFDPR